MSKTTNYRPEIDGLRALAVMPVLFFHAGFSLFSGGYIGVDIFFVISGYLIANIIQREISQNRFSIVNFYERRARRILPALLFISLACIPFAYFWMLPFEIKEFFNSLISINLFLSNFYFWRANEYFSAAAELKPLLHTWSLSVEEQFYVFFPVFLLLLNKFKHSIILFAVISITLLSFALAEYAAAHYPTANFYLLPTRLWELGIGAILALSASFWIKTKPLTAQIGSIIGITGIIFSIFYFDNTTPFPGRWALIPVLSTALIIVFATPHNLVGKLLSQKSLVGIGLISYSTYLWHQPLFAFARIRMEEAPTTTIYLSLIVIALLLGYFTWHFIENPFKNKQQYNRKQIFLSSALLTLFILSISLIGHAKSGIFNKKQAKAAEIQVWRKDYNPRAPECHGGGNLFISPEKACTYNPGLKKKFAIWGDSHALGLAHVLAKTLKEQKFDLTHFTYSACIPTVGIYKTDEPTSQCNAYNKAVLEYVNNSKEIDIVVMHGRWPLYLEGTRFNNQEGGIEYGENAYILPANNTDISISSKPQSRIDAIGALYRKTIESLIAHGKKVVLVYSVPEAGWNVPIKLARNIILDRKVSAPLSTSFKIYKERVKNTHNQLDKLVNNDNLITIHPSILFCNTTIKNRCITQTTKGDPLYFDDNHLNSIGALQLSNLILSSLKKHDWLK